MSEAKPAKTWAGSKSLHRNERKIETGAIDSHVSPCLGVCSVVNEVSSREEPLNGSPQNAHNSSENAPGNTRMKTYHLVGFIEDFVANHQRPHGLQITPRAVQHREIGRLSRISQSPYSRDHERFARRMVTTTAVASSRTGSRDAASIASALAPDHPWPISMGGDCIRVGCNPDADCRTVANSISSGYLRHVTDAGQARRQPMKEWRSTDRTDAAGANAPAGSASLCSPNARRSSRAPARALLSARTHLPPPGCSVYRSHPQPHPPACSRPRTQLAQFPRHPRDPACCPFGLLPFICEICGYRRRRFSASPRPRVSASSVPLALLPPLPLSRGRFSRRITRIKADP